MEGNEGSAGIWSSAPLDSRCLHSEGVLETLKHLNSELLIDLRCWFGSTLLKIKAPKRSLHSNAI